MKKLTQRERTILNSYGLSRNYNLYDIYERPSETKQNIYMKHWKEFVYSDEAIGGFKIISFNKFIFTIGYLVVKDDITYLRYITKNKDELIEI